MPSTKQNTQNIPSDFSSLPAGSVFLCGDMLPDFFEQMPCGIAYCKMLYLDGKPNDFIYLYTNPAFHLQTGLGDVIGKAVSEVIIGISASSPELIDIYGAVASGGGSKNFEIFVDKLEQWFSVQAFSPKAEHFVAILNVINQRKDAEQALIKSEQHYKGLLEDQTEIILRYKADGTMLYVNEAFCRMFGEARENLLGKTWHPVAWHEDIAYINEKLSTLSPANPVVTIENRIVTASGEIRWGQFVNRAFFDEQGVLLETQAIGRDITERKQAEMANLELYQRLTQIASLVPGVIYQYKLRPDGSSCFPYASEAIRDIYRVSPEQVQEDASDVYAILHPDDYESIVASIQQSATSLESWQHEYRVRFADGTVRWLYGNAIPQRLEDESVLWHGFITDITDHKQIEQALQRENIKNQAFLRNASDGITIMDYDGYIVEVSDSFCTMLGYSRQEMLGMHVSQWDAGFAECDVMPIVRQQFEKKVRTQFESRHRRKDSSCYDVEISGFPIELDGQLLLFNSTRDITNHKQLEQQLIASAQEIHNLYDYAPCGYHSIDPNGILININATELQWLDCTREEVIGKKKFSDFFTPESQARYSKIFPKFLIDGYINELELELVSKNGNVRQVSASATAIREANGNFLKSRTVVYDITELKNTQKMLHQLTIEQQAMLNNDLIGIVKLRDRRIVWINKAMERMFGYSVEEMHGQLTRLFYLDDAAYQALGKACYPILNAHGIYRTQIEMLRKDGEKIWMDLSGVELSGKDNESVWMLLDITVLKKYQQKLEYIAYHDVLTGLPNRLLVADRLTQALAHAEREKHYVAVCYIDLDGFKPINDKFGHLTGDKVLIEIAQRMQTAVRVNDTVARLGGDEFLLLLTNLEQSDDYQLILQRFIFAVNQPIILNEACEVAVGASIGVTLYPLDSHDPDILLRHADQAMYYAKQSGRNRVYLFSKDV
jgi:diguanylate cyclase (GGDEF)-like protein/PAS domain S-box-containing protein